MRSLSDKSADDAGPQLGGSGGAGGRGCSRVCGREPHTAVTVEGDPVTPLHVNPATLCVCVRRRPVRYCGVHARVAVSTEEEIDAHLRLRARFFSNDSALPPTYCCHRRSIGEMKVSMYSICKHTCGAGSHQHVALAHGNCTPTEFSDPRGELRHLICGRRSAKVGCHSMPSWGAFAVGPGSRSPCMTARC
jgi:hypothetical protein